jgi:hypothetical protein
MDEKMLLGLAYEIEQACKLQDPRKRLFTIVNELRKLAKERKETS